MKVQEKYLDSNKSLVKEFLNSEENILKILSPMGTGKTNIIRSFLEEENLRILFITNRVSLGLEFKERFEKYNIKFYLDRDYKVGDSLICQYDSIWRYNLKEFDIVIIDEFMSILMHSLSLLSDKGHLNLLKLKILLDSKKLVVLDAFFLNKLDLKSSLSLENTYREETPVVIYKNKNTFLEMLFRDVRRNLRVTISCSSLLTAKCIYRKLKEENKRVFLLSSETPEDYRGSILKELKKEQSLFDVFIFTPTITTGVDILSDFDKHYHYDEGKSCDIISSLQMLKRTRCSSEICIYISGALKYNLTDFRSLNSKMRKDIAQNKIRNSYLVEMDYSTGNYKMSSLGYFYNWILSLYNFFENKHKERFIELLSYQFKNISTNDIVLENSLDLLSIKDDIDRESLDRIKKSLDLKDFENNVTERAKRLLDEIYSLFGVDIPREKLERFILDSRYYSRAKNRRLFQLSLDELKKIKKSKIENFKFNNKDLEEIIYFKENNFELKEFFLLRDLDTRTYKFLRSLGYKSMNCKLVYED